MHLQVLLSIASRATRRPDQILLCFQFRQLSYTGGHVWQFCGSELSGFFLAVLCLLCILDYCRRDHLKLTQKSCLYHIPRCLYCLPRATEYAFEVIPQLVCPHFVCHPLSRGGRFGHRNRMSTRDSAWLMAGKLSIITSNGS